MKHCSVKQVKSIFNRNISVAINQLSETLWQVEARLCDVFHDIILYIDVDTTTLKIVEAQVDYRRIPHEACRLFAPKLEYLKGISLGKGLTKGLIQVAGGPTGCVNIKNLLLTSVPLLLNAYITKDCTSYEEIAEKSVQLLSGTCIAFTKN